MYHQGYGVTKETMAPANVETPVTFSVVTVAPTPEMFIPPLNVAIPVVFVLVVSS